MKLFDVYPLFDVNIVKGKGCKVWDDKGQEYLDLYGGNELKSFKNNVRPKGSLDSRNLCANLPPSLYMPFANSYK